MAISKNSTLYKNRFSWRAVKSTIWDRVKERIGGEYFASVNKCCDIYGESFRDALKGMEDVMTANFAMHVLLSDEHISVIIYYAVVMHLAAMEAVPVR